MAKKDIYYFSNFIECAEYATKAARLLDDIMSNFDADKLPRYSEEMHALEHAADLKKHELSDELIKAFITPIDREDIYDVSRNLDELSDKIEDVLIRIYCNRVSAIRPDAVKITELLVKCCEEVLALMKEFSNFKKPKHCLEHIREINTLEEQGDKLYMDAMYELHGDSDVLAIIAWRDIYTYLEKCLDTAEHIADTVESVITKNS